ncbi:cytotoxic T-lymphocyte protein 4 [Melanotaenia boesemani]|uniref:cytotoxic T-lymphocyte protein 4 n=1 Tax=Melanotaenia boesemani TaxID=1250792 RepID=UPI001C053693|nr:cytotoxic T-lymphocyte protein 4 [Melanotaenia boesemani]
MFLTQCVMGWVALLVLSICLPAWSMVKVTQPYRVMSINGTAQIQCVFQHRTSQHPNDQHLLMPKDEPDFRVTLLKGLHGNQELCSSINFKEQKETPEEIKRVVQCSAQAGDGAVEVTVSGLKATDTDIYRCEIQVFYPPPYLRLMGNGTLIHVVESVTCPSPSAERQQDEKQEEDDAETEAQVSVPVVVLVIVIICVLIIIVYFQTVQCERGRREHVRMPTPFVVPKMDGAIFPHENKV